MVRCFSFIQKVKESYLRIVLSQGVTSDYILKNLGCYMKNELKWDGSGITRETS